jgi:hypothetical protein
MASYTTTAPGVQPTYDDLWGDFSLKVGPGDFTEAVPPDVEPTVTNVYQAPSVSSS